MTRRFAGVASAALLLAAAGISTPAAHASPPAAATPVAAAPPDTLIVVNGDPITGADIDAMIMASHRTMDMRRLADGGARLLLDKAVNDRLLVQQAEAIGLPEEPEMARRLERLLAGRATEAYVRQAFTPPDSVPVERIREHFQTYYGKVHLRQVSARTEQEARQLLAAVRRGADMDSLARAVSLDSHRIEGGLHNLKHWADVEEVLRRQARDLPAGSLSDVFPYREAYSFLRVEQKLPPDLTELPAFEATIRSRELAALRKEAWEAFLDGLARRTPVHRVEPVLAAITADSAKVVHADFQQGGEEPALLLVAGGGDSLRVSDRELRLLISRAAMEGGGVPFAAMLEKGLAEGRQDLLLRAAAAAAGWFDDPGVLSLYARDRAEKLLEAYLEQAILPGITFQRDEFGKYWKSHQDEFRDPEEIRLATVLIDDETKGPEAAARLAEGADFEHVRRRYGPPGDLPPSKWVQLGGFSDEIRRALAELPEGRDATGVETPSGWLLLKVEGRRPGRVRSLEDSEMQIRGILFQKRFQELMDEHLGLLKERSRIVRNEDRIARYLAGEGGAEATP